MKEQSNGIPTEQVYGMFEEIKEIIEKRPASEASGGTATNDDTVIQKLDETKSAIDRNAEQVAALTNRIGQIEFRPIVQAKSPDMKDVNNAFDQIKNYSANVATHIGGIRNDIKAALSDEKIERTVQQAASHEVTQYKTMLDNHWERIDNSLDHLYKRIPYNYDIDKWLVKSSIVLALLFGFSIVGNAWQWKTSWRYRDNDWKYRYLQAGGHGEIDVINYLDRTFGQQDEDNIDDVKQTVKEYEKEIRERGAAVVNKERSQADKANCK